MLLLTDEDDFNALASVLLAESVEGRVFRLAPPQPSHGVVAPYTTGEILFGNGMTRPVVTQRYQDGSRIITHGADDMPAADKTSCPRMPTASCRRDSDQHADAAGDKV